MCSEGVSWDGENVRCCGMLLLKQNGGYLVFCSKVGDDLELGLGDSFNVGSE